MGWRIQRTNLMLRWVARQALLNQTTAEIAQADAKYEHHLKRAVLDYQIGVLK